GGTVKIGESEPAQVVGLAWRITLLRDPDGIAINIPNRKVTEASIVNLTRTHGATYDAAPILVPARLPVKEVVGRMEEALRGCPIILEKPGPGVGVAEMTGDLAGVHYGGYVPFYFVVDRSKRDEARAEVLGRISAALAEKGVFAEPAASPKVAARGAAEKEATGS